MSYRSITTFTFNNKTCNINCWFWTGWSEASAVDLSAGRVDYCWSSPAQSFLVLGSAWPMTIFFCLTTLIESWDYSPSICWHSKHIHTHTHTHTHTYIYIYIYERFPFYVSVGAPAILTEILCGFPQSLLENIRIVPLSGNDRLLPTRFQFIVRKSTTIRCYVV
jgi:hypothetical protein